MTKRRPLITPSIVALLLAAFYLVPTALAQSSTATLSGAVEDQRGAVIPGAKIMVRNIGTALVRNATTNESGSFTIPLLPPGEYTVLVEREGFTRVQLTGITLNVGDQKAVQVQLKVGDIQGEVQVTPDASLVRTDGSVGTVIDRTFVENIPLNGRSFQTLIALTPGVVLTKAGPNEAGQFSINGQRANANYFTIDGASANIGVIANSGAAGQSFGGTLPGLSASGGTNNLVSVDALQEFKVQTSSFAPEFGRTPGGQIQIQTRSGTNGFRGNLFEYLRNEALDANNWFSNRAGLPRTALRQHDFGGVIGGPILFPRYNGRDRTFFFFSYERLRLRQPVTSISDVPSLTTRQNAAANLRPYLNAYPLPNGPLRPNGAAQFVATFSNPSSLDSTGIRIDHALTKKSTLFGRLNISPSKTSQRGISGVSPSVVNDVGFHTSTLTFGSTYILNPQINNEIRLNVSRNRGQSSFFGDNFGGAVVPDDALLFPSFTSRDEATFTMGFTAGSTQYVVGRSSDNLQRQFNILDNFSIVAGSHSLKFGVDYRRLSPVFGPRSYAISVFLPSPVAAGTVSSGSVSTQVVKRVPLYHNFSMYGQDTWMTTSRLSLTYGLRWEINPAPREANDKYPLALKDAKSTATLTFATPGTELYRTTHGNFAPRIGAAYQLFIRQGFETILRGGFGVFYDLGESQAGNVFFSVPYTGSRSLAGVPFPLSAANMAAPSVNSNPPFNELLFAVDPELELPYTNQWNFAVEQSLGHAQTISATYVGAVGRRLLRTEQLTQSAGLNPALFGSLALLRLTRNAATSNYHAMQLQFDRRFSSGLQVLASYTWAKSIDNASNDSGVNVPLERIDPNLDRGPSDFDVRHAFNAAITYNMPRLIRDSVFNWLLREWSLDAIITARTGTPVDVTYSRNIGFGVVALRPDLVAGVPIYVDDPAAPGGRRINNASLIVPGNPLPQIGPFLRPVTARQGNLGRNALRGFSFSQLNLALRRQFSLSERLKLQLRVEAFNVFNRPIFADPIGSLTSSSFGVSNSTLNSGLGAGGVSGGFLPLYQIGGPRSMQLSLRLSF